MKVKGYLRETAIHYTKALKLIKDGRVRIVISYSKSKKGYWLDSKKNSRKLGYLKSRELIYTARALVLFSHKFSILIENKNYRSILR